MVGPDLPGLVCVRRINDARGGAASIGSSGDRDAWAAALPPRKVNNALRDGKRASLATRAGAATAPAATAVAPPKPPPDETYLALRISDSAEVAVRVYRRRVASEQDRLRFEQEVAALKALNDVPHVARIYGAGVTAAGQAYLVMEYCPAGSLLDHLTKVGRLGAADVRRIGAKIAGALANAHRREIYHRGVKPSNVLIDAGGQPALSDFGLVAMAVSDGDFKPPLPPRPRAYVAPEAYLPELMSAGADVYALGATLYSLLAGWAPRTSDPLAVAVDGETIADLPRVPWALMGIIRRAMAIDPLDRFADADELRFALERGV